MQCDLNDYYPSCNLPRLYRARGDPDDARRASAATQVAMLACERAKARGSQDEWLNPTLLGLAFDAGDIGTARRLIADVRREGPAAWKLETTLADLERSVQQLADDGSRTAFSQLLETLRSIASLRH
jgi:hypothetical protein